MDLLTISDNKVLPSPYTLTIPEFKNLSIEEKRKLADEREEKVINWFKNLFTGE